MPAKNVAPKSNELKLTRVYDAPVALVWDAWTDPEQVSQWWGPRGFTLTTHGKDLRPGGYWRYTMHGPDGVDYPNHTIYHEVEKHSRLVYDHGGYDDRPPMFRVTVTFAETRGKTTMEMTMAFPSAEIAAESKIFIKKAGGNGTWDRLAEFLSDREPGEHAPKFVLNRTFETTPDELFSMWTETEHLARWIAPTGFSTTYYRSDFTEGGSTFYKMSGAGGELYGRAEYVEVRRPDLLSFRQQFCDENEKVIRHPMAPTWPETWLTTVTFEEEAPGTTRMTLVSQPIGNTTAEERAAFAKERGGMTNGWTGSLDRLEDALAGSVPATAPTGG